MFDGDDNMAADAKSYSTTTVPLGAEDQSDAICDQGMEALVINEDEALSPESKYIPVEQIDSATDSQIVLCDKHTAKHDRDSKEPQISPVHCVSRTTAHGSNKPARSPARGSGHRPYSFVEERAKRFGEHASKSDTAMINNGSATIPFAKRSAGYKSDGSLIADHASHNIDHANSDGAVSRLSKGSPVIPAESDKNVSASVDEDMPSEVCPAVMPWSRSPVCQAPPPAETLSLPSAPVAAVETLSGIFYEPAPSYQSVRVEPSPERILTTFGSIDEEEEIAPITAPYVDAALRTPETDFHATSLTRSGNQPRKVVAFFGDSVSVADEFLGLESAVDGTSESASKKDISTRFDHKAGVGKKQWSVVPPKSHTGHPVSPRPKKPGNDREPSSSPKQKDHKFVPGSTPSPVSVIPSPPQATWKDRVNPFKRHGSGSALTVIDTASPVTSGVIGVPLCSCQPGSNANVPLIVELCTKIIEEKGIENQGIYRVSGNTGALNGFIEDLNKDPVLLCQDHDKWQDVNVVSGLLKKFFRSLPDSLITDELYNLAINANKTENSEKRMLKLKKILHDLPERNFETLRFLAQHLRHIASREEANRMDSRNLAIIFGPSLIRPIDDNMAIMVRDMSDQCKIIESIISHCDWYFSSWDEDVNVPVDEEPDDSTPVSAGSSQILMAKADSLVNNQLFLIAESQYKETIAQSIIQAANRKKRKDKEKNNRQASDSSSTPLSFTGKLKLPGSLSKSKLKESPSAKSQENLCEPRNSEPSIISVETMSSEMPPVRAEDDVDIPFEVVRYPAYRFDNVDVYCVENSKPRSIAIRRAKSNDNLLTKSRATKSPAVSQQRQLPDNSSTVGYSTLQYPYSSVSSEQKGHTNDIAAVEYGTLHYPYSKPPSVSSAQKLETVETSSIDYSPISYPYSKASSVSSDGTDISAYSCTISGH